MKEFGNCFYFEYQQGLGRLGPLKSTLILLSTKKKKKKKEREERKKKIITV